MKIMPLLLILLVCLCLTNAAWSDPFSGTFLIPPYTVTLAGASNVRVPAYIRASDSVCGFSIVLKWQGTLPLDSVVYAGTAIQGWEMLGSTIDTINKTVIFYGSRINTPAIAPGDSQLVAYLEFAHKSGCDPTEAYSISYDTTTVGPASTTVSDCNSVPIIPTIQMGATSAVGSYLPGNANWGIAHDCSVNIGDVVFLINYVFKGGPAPVPLNAGDPNADCHINVGDVVYLINYLFKHGSAPALGCAGNGTVTDYDGYIYRTVTIGTQVWMAENLKVTHYRNGDAIPNETDGPTWEALTTGAYCEYDNNVANVATYGRLYNWYAAVDSRNIAPVGWHVPSDAEWKQLEIYLGMSPAVVDDILCRGTDEAGEMKEIGTLHWFDPNAGATNRSGFTGLPGGYRFDWGGYWAEGVEAVFWTSTESSEAYAWYRILDKGNPQICRDQIDGKRDGFSIRCVKD